MERLLRRDGRRTLDWRMDELAVGDKLVIPVEEADFNAVYNYAKPRSYRLGIHVTVAREGSDTVVTRTASPERVEKDPINRPCLPGSPCDWGVMRRTVLHPRWRWPFRHMEMGDQFRVAMEDIPANVLRQKAHHEGWLRGMKFKVEVDPLTAPGYIVVKRVLEAQVQHDVASFGVVKTHVLNCYETDNPDHRVDPGGFDKRVMIENIDNWMNMPLGEKKVAFAKRVADPPRNSYLVEVKPLFEERGKFAVDLFEDRIEIERVDFDMTHEKWATILRERIDEALS